MNKITILTGLLLASWCQMNAAELQLSFTRSGTTAGDVTVTAGGIDGVTAELTSVSHTLKGITNNAVICPDVNGNTNPEISYVITVNGLPATERFNTLGLDIHALNGAGAYQQPNDNKKRQWNVTASINDNEFASYNDIDIAAGVTEGHKVWTATATDAVTATSPLVITINVGKGTANEGCFFGLSNVTLSYVEAEPTPDPDPDPDPDDTDAKVYTIKWKNNTSSYITSQADGSIAVGSYATSSPMFWKFIPTDNENCYYIQNTANDLYIGSCNLTPGSSSRVQMSSTPVEYYVGRTSATEGEIAGCVWLTSTDCANYSSETSDARALNKDGASSYVITWQNGTGRVGSYWTLTETEDLYEPRPFEPVAAIGAKGSRYHITGADGKYFTADGQWADPDETADRNWYFVGTGNTTGGYQIVSAANDTPLNDGATYRIAYNGDTFSFLTADDSKLDFAGQTDINFVAARSAFALANQIYKMPCGPIGDVFVRKISIGDNYHYPMAQRSSTSGNMTFPSVSPTNKSKYVLYTIDAATVERGKEVSMSITLNKEPGEHTMRLYADWNRDGVFEAAGEITAAKEATATIAVPADAAKGKTRLRLRLNTNGLNGADDDVAGQIVDLMLNVVDGYDAIIEPTVTVNDPARGTATWADGVATATPKGNALFLCWLEGYKVVSIDQNYACSTSALPRVLTAVFSANTEPESGIGNLTADTQSAISFDGRTISVKGSRAKSILLFGIDGTVAARGGSQLAVGGIAPGIYIVKAATERGTVSAKIKL